MAALNSGGDGNAALYRGQRAATLRFDGLQTVFRKNAGAVAAQRPRLLDQFRCLISCRHGGQFQACHDLAVGAGTFSPG